MKIEQPVLKSMKLKIYHSIFYMNCSLCISRVWFPCITCEHQLLYIVCVTYMRLSIEFKCKLNTINQPELILSNACTLINKTKVHVVRPKEWTVKVRKISLIFESWIFITPFCCFLNWGLMLICKHVLGISGFVLWAFQSFLLIYYYVLRTYFSMALFYWFDSVVDFFSVHLRSKGKVSIKRLHGHKSEEGFLVLVIWRQMACHSMRD